MILKRYGTSYHSVTPNFNPTAITEIGFMRDRARSIRVDDFDAGYRLVDEVELGAEADAKVQRHAERTLLEKLERSLGERVASLRDGQVLIIRNERDDWPKTRERKEGVIVDGENRFHFHWWVDPPLKVGIYGAE